MDVQMDGTGLSFTAFYVKNNVIVAVASMNKDPVVVHASELLRLGRMPSVEKIRAGLDLLTITI